MRSSRPTRRVAPGRTRANDPEGLRERVLDAAEALFQAQGYASTSTHDLFAAAGVTSGAFYHHFASKKDLGLAVVRERVAAAVEQAWLAPMRDAATTLDGVRAVFTRIARELDAQRAVRGCPLNNLTLELAFADPDFRRELKTVLDAWRGVIANKLQADLDRKWLRKHDPDALASYIIAVYSGAMALAKLEQGSRPLAVCLAELARTIQPASSER